MARKLFSAQEKALIEAALASDGRIQVQNVTQWHDATIVTGSRIERDEFGWHRIRCTIDRTRGSIRAGDPWPASPGHVRARRVS